MMAELPGFDTAKPNETDFSKSTDPFRAKSQNFLNNNISKKKKKRRSISKIGLPFFDVVNIISAGGGGKKKAAEAGAGSFMLPGAITSDSPPTLVRSMDLSVAEDTTTPRLPTGNEVFIGIAGNEPVSPKSGRLNR
jgi:hypothetical protein